MPGLYRVNDKRMDLCLSPFVIGFVKECYLLPNSLKEFHMTWLFSFNLWFSFYWRHKCDWMGGGWVRTKLNERPGLYSERKQTTKINNFLTLWFKMAPNYFPRIFSWEIFLWSLSLYFKLVLSVLFLCKVYSLFMLLVIFRLLNNQLHLKLSTISLILNASGIQY